MKHLLTAIACCLAVAGSAQTSYNPDIEGRSSGASGSDVERILAFHAIGREDPVTYVKPWEVVLRNALAVEKTHQEMKT